MEKKQGLVKPSLTEGEQDSVADDVRPNVNTNVIATKRGNYVIHTLYTVNRKTFTGLNFRGIHSIWIFTVILSRYKASDQHMFILGAKIHRKNFRASLKDAKTAKVKPSETFPVYGSYFRLKIQN